ncbi:MAG: hypothetical protein GY754_18770 [bacterium]|nr:hypothetical protein [bacterium]MCP4133016.1 hypothetical protein [bacterium]
MINMNDYPEIKPGISRIKRIYASIMLLVVGRGIQAAAAVDRDAKKEFANLRDDFMLQLSIAPNGPYMFVGKNEKGKVKYMGWNPKGKKSTLEMRLKSMEAATLLLTFQEKTAIASCNDRLLVQGNLQDACAVLRLFDIVEMYLLPKFITKFAVKRYPHWSQVSPVRKHLGRILIYLRLITG